MGWWLNQQRRSATAEIVDCPDNFLASNAVEVEVEVKEERNGCDMYLAISYRMLYPFLVRRIAHMQMTVTSSCRSSWDLSEELLIGIYNRSKSLKRLVSRSSSC